jgi:hypothetical protein
MGAMSLDSKRVGGLDLPVDHLIVMFAVRTPERQSRLETQLNFAMLLQF